ncbi:unnamed protein product [Callosobruchus maculatus]|uniref:Uncharacterized protein n=1 Tax=Callosobruchus maculatus TaxID=64391 RepID=A0A653CZE5_CALMS|nr:unnamed protein product [Callosobruchus maculatus]
MEIDLLLGVEVFDCLLPTHFDIVLVATKSLSRATRSKHNSPEFDIPSLALKLGHALKKLHENAVETTKISRLLLAVEKGEANRYARRSLDKIHIEDEDIDEVCKAVPDQDAYNVDSDTNGASSDDETPLAVLRKKLSSKQDDGCKTENNIAKGRKKKEKIGLIKRVRRFHGQEKK